MKDKVICGFAVSAERQKVWQTELEMVKLFIKICEDNNLKYVASGGTLLGAVRHGGFIPWDDDVDLMMPRADYDKFLEIAQNCLPEGFFLQCNRAEKGYLTGHAQIRNSNTACLLSYEYFDLKRGKNLGIFIDIFPYDYVPDEAKKRAKHAKKIKFLKRMINMRLYSSVGNKFKRLIKKILTGIYFLGCPVERSIEKVNTLSKKYTNTNTVALVSFMPGYEKNVWDAELFDKTVMHDFEDIRIAIPERYDEVLRKEFGDYMQIPEDKGGSMHGKCYFDTQKSYKEYACITQDEFNETLKNFVL